MILSPAMILCPGRLLTVLCLSQFSLTPHFRCLPSPPTPFQCLLKLPTSRREFMCWVGGGGITDGRCRSCSGDEEAGCLWKKKSDAVPFWGQRVALSPLGSAR
uniref:Uncharacterized protein n=1 Tax=Sphaerodactylus townsendi TaxID=933632 RepID=A0ACB8FV26_9SAUR